MDRNKTVIRVSYLGIVVNVALVIVKAIIGLMVHSIAIILDAVNNLSDALSQIITIVAMKLSAKAPDKKHPYGYGRIEYLSTIIIAAMIIAAGVTSLKESVAKVIHPVNADYTFISLVIVAIAVVVKFFFGRYVVTKGEEVHSQTLIASGKEATMDGFLSLSTLVAAIVSMLFHISLEGILGTILSLFILKAGFEALKETVSSLIGDRSDSDLTKEIKAHICEHEGVNGAYDLVLHDYGPSRSIGTVHIEVDDQLNARDIHLLTRRIISDVQQEYNIQLTVGIYASNISDQKILDMKQEATKIVDSYEYIKSLHGFYVDFEYRHMVFDILVSFRSKNPVKLMEHVREDMLNLYPEYTIDINIDHDFSD